MRADLSIPGGRDGTFEADAARLDGVRLTPVGLRESAFGFEMVLALHIPPGYFGTVRVHASRDGRVLRREGWEQLSRDLLPDIDERIAKIAADAAIEWPALVERTAA